MLGMNMNFEDHFLPVKRERNEDMSNEDEAAVVKQESDMYESFESRSVPNAEPALYLEKHESSVGTSHGTDQERNSPAGREVSKKRRKKKPVKYTRRMRLLLNEKNSSSGNQKHLADPPNAQVNFFSIPGKRRGSELILSSDGHLYCKNNRSNRGVLHLRCWLKDEVNKLTGNCPGTAKINADNHLDEMHPHNHEANHKEVQARRLVIDVRKAVQSDRSGRTIRQIFDDVTSDSPVRHLVRFNALRATLKRDRDMVSVPPAPARPDSALDLLSAAPPDYRASLVFSVTAGAGESAVGFAAEEVTAHVREHKTTAVQVDTTFQELPKTGGFQRLMVFFFEATGRMRPGYFVLLSHRSRGLYSSVIGMIQRTMPSSLAPVFAVTDCDQALVSAITEGWPSARLSSCHLDFCRSVYGELWSRDLVQVFRDTPGVREWCGLLLALPLLPENRLLEGVRLLHQNLPTHVSKRTASALRSLAECVTAAWLPVLAAGRLCLPSRQDCTHADAEAFLQKLSHELCSQHDFWSFVLSLNKLIAGVNHELRQSELRRATRAGRPRLAQLEPLLQRWSADLAAGRIGALTLLQAAGRQLLTCRPPELDQSAAAEPADDDLLEPAPAELGGRDPLELSAADGLALEQLEDVAPVAVPEDDLPDPLLPLRRGENAADLAEEEDLLGLSPEGVRTTLGD